MLGLESKDVSKKPHWLWFRLFNLQLSDSVRYIRNISHNIALKWMSESIIFDKLILVHAMTWYHQATNHYLNYCFSKSNKGHFLLIVAGLLVSIYVTALQSYIGSNSITIRYDITSYCIEGSNRKVKTYTKLWNRKQKCRAIGRVYVVMDYRGHWMSYNYRQMVNINIVSADALLIVHTSKIYLHIAAEFKKLWFTQFTKFFALPGFTVNVYIHFKMPYLSNKI